MQHLPTVQHQGDARGVHTLTLNDPERFNVLSAAMLGQLHQALDVIAADDGARVLVLRATGRAFCAGHDLREMAALPDEAAQQALFEQCSRFMLRLASLPVPVVAVVHGVATAAGCQLVAQCDLAVASDAARFGVNGIDVGLFCATPSVALTRKVGAALAADMLMTGRFLSATEALVAGLVSRVCADPALDGAAQAMVDALVQRPAAALRIGKTVLAQQQGLGLHAAYAMAGAAMAHNMMLPCAQHGVQAFLSKRAVGA
jgi:enoyl-CoA hydratase/carnithine racemase